ncbi:hypothetical protein PC9H_003902 [Pleurotus ostreatus]|uniref:Uncharacterized protein n=1 Tax=Pleurotus ostreatus TaxID=5322 RepID=A0A8H6ZZ95_PLEOS|nr:uncharacterized protein PC9H_003902 [Pleurotus ostreatus]KAF7437068.1 hypothetical protein PC9H_003902 [Pleurotus ostreatus]KAJ8702913.1 hypothetical protein PTI98_001586 [Pleurotus ostreatus]
MSSTRTPPPDISTTIFQSPSLLSHTTTEHPDYDSGPHPIALDPSEWGGSGSAIHLGAYAFDWELEQPHHPHNETDGADNQRSQSLLDRIVRNMREQLEEQYSPAKKSRLEKMRCDLRDVDVAVQIRCYKVYKAVRRRRLSLSFWKSKP